MGVDVQLHGQTHSATVTSPIPAVKHSLAGGFVLRAGSTRPEVAPNDWFSQAVLNCPAGAWVEHSGHGGNRSWDKKSPSGGIPPGILPLGLNTAIILGASRPGSQRPNESKLLG